jgi:hypothetical protein
LRSSPARDAGTAAVRRFWLYVEGPRDREVLRGWAQACDPGLASVLEASAVILGGRRPARAVEHFRGHGAPADGIRGLCVLDRDGEPQAHDPVSGAHDVPGLAFFTWTRRHIESYLLLPEAIRRGMRLPPDDVRVDRILRAVLPPACDEEAWRGVDAKRLLAHNGPLALGLGRTVPLGRVARAMREREIHPDVHRLFAAVREALGRPRKPRPGP